MNRFKTKIVGLATAILLSAGALIAPLTSSAVTIDELMAQIAVLQAQLLTLQGPSASTADKCSFTRSLTVGSRGDDVTCLQNYLKTGGHLSVSATGYFGSLTKAAAAKWQSANGVSPAAGYFGSLSRAKYDSLMAAVVVTPVVPVTPTTSTTTAPVVTGTGLTITSATQPANDLAVATAARLPFTKVTLTAGSQDVVVTGVTVERTGKADDAVFSGVVLLDETGAQLGIAKTFNSDHKATVGETVTIKAGTSQTFTVAGNMNTVANNAGKAGQVASLSVTGVTTSATVSGLLPITGALHTINTSVSIGSVTNNRGSIDPNSSTGAVISKEVGTTGYTFASVKFTAGSAEKIKVKSIRWNQSGSAATSDLANIKTYIDGTAYDTVVSSDGKYYTSTFGTDGILVDKGNSVEISVKGDIAGGSGRTIDFDLYKNTDVAIYGENYGYGLTAPLGSTDPTDDSSNFSSGAPWYDASQISVSAGTLTVEKATSVAADNIAVNISNQKLGGFIIEAKGEAITVASTVFTVASSSGSGNGLLTNVSLVDENGTVVAGPVDATYAGATTQTVTFTDTISYGIGKKTYTLKGKVSSTIGTNTAYSVATTPASNWTSVTGQTTGNTITPSPASAVTANTMTVKAAVATVSVSTSPVAQTIVGGVSGFNFANFVFDASASGEDIKFSSLALRYAFTTVASNTLTGCKLKDGTTEVNTDSPNLTSHTSTSDVTFTLSSAGLVIPKGTFKTIALNCNVAGSISSGNYTWGMATAPSGTGLTSGQSVTATLSSSNGQQMSLGSGSLTVAADSSTPNYTMAAAGTSGVTLGVLKVSATNEAIKLTKLGLKMTNNTINGTASSTISDLTSISLYDGSTLIGTSGFTATTSTTTLSANLIIPKDGYKLLTIKGSLTGIGTVSAGQQGALIAVDFVGAGNAEGVGQSSGTAVTSTSAVTAFSGVRMFRSYPTVAKLSGVSTSAVAGEIDLYRFSIAANPSGTDGIGLRQFTVNIATTSGSAVSGTTTVTDLKVYAYTDSGMTSPVGGYTNGQVVTTVPGLASSGNNDAELSSVLQVPAGSTYYFKVKGTVTKTAGSGTYSGSVTTKISGDTGYPSLSTLMGTIATVDTGTLNKFVWSPNATTTSSATHVDWTNGYFVSGLHGDMDTNTISIQ